MADSVISLPKVTLNIIPSAALVGIAEQKVLFVGQKTAAGSATSGDLEQSILGVADIDARFGKTSHLAQMMRAARELNGDTQFDAIALDDAGAAVKATTTVIFTGTATAAARLTFQFMSAKNRSFDLDVKVGDTAAVSAAALDALITADTKAPFTSGVAVATVTLTAENGGTIYNGSLTRVTGSVAGLTAALVAWASGATDPVLTTLFDVIDGIRYQTVVYPAAFSRSVLTDELDARFNATNDVLDGVGIVSDTDTLVNLGAAAVAEDSRSLVVFGNKPVALSNFIGSHILELDDVTAAEFGALRSLRLTDGANLANAVVTAAGPLDQFGGISLATLPYSNTPAFNIPVGPPNTFWSDLERSSLEDDGVSVIGPNKTRNLNIVAQVFTTRTTDGAGNPDTSFKFLNTVDASSAGREFQFVNLKKRYVQSRLTKGDLVAGRSMANEASIRAFVLSLFTKLGDLAIYQTGPDALKAFDQSLAVTITLTAGVGLVSITQAPPLVGQLREITGTIQINFGAEG